MARTADHEARRQQIRDALLAVARRDGLERVSIPTVASQAGISVGLVQHYYPSKHLLLADAQAALLARIEARVDAAVAAAESRHERIEHILAEALTQLLPLDELRTQEWRLTRAFEALALTREDLAAAVVAARRTLRARVAAAIVNGRSCGEVTDPHLDEQLEAAALLAHVQALADELAWGTGVTRTMTEAVIAADCARLFPGHCSHHG